LGKHLDYRTSVFYGGVPLEDNIKTIKKDRPHIVVGTPGRILELVNKGYLNLSNVSTFILDECDKVLESQKMREDVQRIFVKTPHSKQVMMFSGTMSEEAKSIARKFMQK